MSSYAGACPGATLSSAATYQRAMSAFSSNEALWSQVPKAPSDAILALTVNYKNDPSETKANLGVGAYRDDNGEPWVLPAVRRATEELLRDPKLNHEYLPITGYAPFTAAAAKLMFGDDAPVVKEARIATNQTISGSGAVHLGAVFLHDFYPFPKDKTVYVSDPTWPNHFAILKAAGLSTQTYTYYDSSSRSLHFEGMYRDLASLEDGSVVLLHACAHNPTGVDPTEEQWKKLADLFAEKKLFAFFDSAYQGFASGDPAKDAFSVRLFAERGISLLVAESFAKNAGLYGERIGALHIATASSAQAEAVLSQLNTIVRRENSTMPAFGARIVTKILTEPELRAEWDRDIKTMSRRIISMREQLYDLLTNKFHTPGSWEHIKTQTGMFSYLGLDEAQCDRLIREGHIYLMRTGRVSMSGFNPSNVEYIASWIDKVVRERS